MTTPAPITAPTTPEAVLARLRPIWPQILAGAGGRPYYDATWAGLEPVGVDLERRVVQLQAAPGVTHVKYQGQLTRRLVAQTRQYLTEVDIAYVELRPYVTAAALVAALATVPPETQLRVWLDNQVAMPETVVAMLLPGRILPPGGAA